MKPADLQPVHNRRGEPQLKTDTCPESVATCSNQARNQLCIRRLNSGQIENEPAGFGIELRLKGPEKLGQAGRVSEVATGPDNAPCPTCGLACRVELTVSLGHS